MQTTDYKCHEVIAAHVLPIVHVASIQVLYVTKQVSVPEIMCQKLTTSSSLRYLSLISKWSISVGWSRYWMSRQTKECVQCPSLQIKILSTQLQHLSLASDSGTWSIHQSVMKLLGCNATPLGWSDSILLLFNEATLSESSLSKVDTVWALSLAVEGWQNPYQHLQWGQSMPGCNTVLFHVLF